MTIADYTVLLRARHCGPMALIALGDITPTATPILFDNYPMLDDITIEEPVNPKLARDRLAGRVKLPRAMPVMWFGSKRVAGMDIRRFHARQQRL